MSDNPLEGMEHYAAMANKIAEHPDIKPQIFAIGKLLHSDWMAYQGAAGAVRTLAEHVMEADTLTKVLGIGEGFMAKAGLKRLTQMIPEKLPEAFDALPPPPMMTVRDLVCLHTLCGVVGEVKAGDIGPHHAENCPRYCSAYDLP